MSKEIDQRVVEMRFDNQHFEKNVQTSLSTLDKLKQRLNLSGAAKGLDDVNSAASRVNMNPLSNGVMQVQAKFSALQVMAITALQNITNQAVNAGKRLVAAFTIDPVKSGFSEYETQIGAIQTILANTSHAGTTLGEVNDALDELNLYADKTIYNFTEMTRNIGTFTAAGVDLETSVDSIKGIANLAAVSGSTSQQASTAMYQLSQALAAGKVSLMDWNSVVNAGMGGKVFQDALTRTSELLGTGAQAAIDTYGSFRESLTKGEWLTTEVLTETLKQFAGSYSEADLISQGFTEAQAADIAKMANTAVDAATKVKTFTQLMDALKASAQSGWTQSWEIIIGDFEEAIELFTGISDAIGGFIGKISDRRNAILESAFGRSFTELGERLKGITDRIKTATAPIEKVIDTMKDLGDVVDKVILGSFGNGEDRLKALTDAGVNYYEVQNKVNETLNVGFRYTEEQIAAQDKLLGVVEKSTETTDDATKASETLTKTRAKQLELLSELSDGELRSKGYTTEQIAAIRELRAEADKLGMSVSDFFANMNKMDGRWIVIDSFKNLAKALSEIGKAISAAWRKIFYGDATDEKIIQKKADILYNIIAAFHKFTETIANAVGSLNDADSTASKIMRTFQGLFAILDLIKTIVGGVFKVAFDIAKGVLEAFNLDVLDVVAGIGDAIVKFRDWFKENNFIVKGLTALITGIVKVVKVVKEWIDAFLAMPEVQSAITTVQSAFTTAMETIGPFFTEGFKRIGEFIDRIKSMDGLTLDNIGAAFKDFWDNVVGYFINAGGLFDGIRKEFDSFIATITGKFSEAGGVLGDFQTKLTTIFEFIKSKIPAVIAILMGFGLIKSISKIANALSLLAHPIESLMDIADGLGDVLHSFSGYLNAKAMRVRADAIFKIALAIAVLAGSLFLISQINSDRLWASVGALAAIIGLLAILTVATSLINKFVGVSTVSISILALAGSILIIAAALKMLESLEADKLLGTLGILALVAIGLLAAASAFSLAGPALNKGVFGVLALTGALWLMSKTIKSIEELDIKDIGKTIVNLLIVMGTLAVATAAVGRMTFKSSLGLMMMVLGLKLLIGVIQQISELDMTKISNNLEAFLIIFGSLGALVLASRLMGANATFKAGLGILALSSSLFVILNVLKQLGDMPAAVMDKALSVLKRMMLVFMVIVVASKFAGEHAVRAGLLLLMMSGAILVLTGVIMLLKDIPTEGLAKAVAAISTIGLIFAGIIVATKWSKNVLGTLIVLTIVLTAIAAALMIMANMNVNSLLSSAAALSVAVAAFSLLMVAIRKMPVAFLPRKLAMLSILTLVVAALAGVVYALGTMPNPKNVLPIAAGLSLLIISLGGAVALLGKLGFPALKAMGPAALLAAIVAALGGVVVLLSLLNVGPVLEIAGSMTMLVLALAVTCNLLYRFGVPFKRALVPVAILTIIIAALGGILAILGRLNVGRTIEIASSISLLLLALAGATSILSKIGAVGMAPILTGIAGVALLLGVVALVVGAILGIGALIASQEGSLDLIIKAGLVLEELGRALGKFFGGIIGGFSEGATSGIPAIGTHLSEFMTNLKPFIAGIEAMDDRVLAGIATLAGVILAMSAAEFLNGLSALIPFGKGSFDSFGASLTSFGKSLMDYADTVKDLTDDQIAAITRSAEAATAVANLANLIPKKGGMAGWLFGEVNMVDFGVNISSFGRSLMDYAEIVSGLTAGDVKTISTSAEAGAALGKMAESIPKKGGKIQWLFGEVDLVHFGTNITSFAMSLMDYAEIVSGLTSSDKAAIDASAGATEAIAKAAALIPPEGGVLQWLFGAPNITNFGKSMESFGNSLMVYAETIDGFTKADVANINATIDGTKALRGVAELIPEEGGWLRAITGAPDIKNFGEGMVALAKGLSSYAAVAKTVGVAEAVDITISKQAIIAMKDVAAEVPGIKGLHDTFHGTKDISAFGNGMVALAQGLSAYSIAVSGGIDEAKIADSADAVDAMVKVANLIPTEGGVAEIIFGKKSLASFGSNLSGFADSLMLYVGKVRDFTMDDVKAVNRSAVATTQLIKAFNDMEEAGGIKSIIMGTTDFAQFGANLVTFGNGLMSYVGKIRGLSTDDVAQVIRSKMATMQLALAAEAIPPSGGKLSWLFGESNLAAFGANLVTFADNLVAYVGKVKSLKPADVTTAGNVKAITEKMAEAAAYIPTIAKNATIDGFTTAMENMKTFSDLASVMSETDFGGMSSFSSTLTTLGETGVSDFIKAFDGSEYKLSTAGARMVMHLSDGVKAADGKLKSSFKVVADAAAEYIDNFHGKFKTAGKKLVEKIGAGITDSNTRELAKSKVGTLMTSLITKIDGYYDDFKSSARYLVEGFASGITANTWRASAAAETMARSATLSAQAELDEHSPSKVFYGIGSFAGEGFVNALSDYESISYNSGRQVARSAIDGLSSSISKIGELVSADMDTTPTIRPVLDLSDVRSGVRTMNGMMGLTPSTAVLSNIGSVNAMMSGRQNGSNSDVVSAIKSLNDKLDGQRGDTYVVNGITYDDGSNITDAVKSLVRAAKVERRR